MSSTTVVIEGFLTGKIIVEPSNIENVVKVIDKLFSEKSFSVKKEQPPKPSKTLSDIRIKEVCLKKEGEYLQILLIDDSNKKIVLCQIHEDGKIGSLPVLMRFPKGFVLRTMIPGEETIDTILTET